jgi:histidinol dehydrogenase
VIRASLQGRGALVHSRSMEEACALSNRIAPEHLEVSSAEPERWEPLLKHAGAIFLGAYTSESLGDYCAGPNHVLPTSGTARFSSPLGVYDFVKRTSLIEVSEAGAQTLGPVAAELAYGEGLQAHARAAELRLRTDALPPQPAAVSFSVRPVDKANVDAVLALQVAPGQRRLVASVERSLAQVAHEPRGRALAFFDGDSAVGMMLLYDARQDDEKPANQLYVWRLLVDARHQRRGLGRLAMEWVVAEAERGAYAEVGLSHVDKAGHAGGFYEKLGFVYTGEVDDGELKMLLKLGGTSPTVVPAA